MLLSTLSALQDKAQHLEYNLSAETRIKLDLFSALGDARRQLEIAQGSTLFLIWALAFKSIHFFWGGGRTSSEELVNWTIVQCEGKRWTARRKLRFKKKKENMQTPPGDVLMEI